MPGSTLRTIGHSTLSIDSFVHALQEHGCDVLVDVRRYPGSRRYPQFGQERLFACLAEAGMRAFWREGLGGRRKPQTHSVNTAWRNQAFRGYADYMQTPEFSAEIDWLTQQMQECSLAVMCAEAVPWRCHRSLIADAVLARGFEVEDILVSAQGSSSRRSHVLTSFARTEDGRVWYPGEAQGALFEPRGAM
jgi:uncharacterized protein (DUF488 family)